MAMLSGHSIRDAMSSCHKVEARLFIVPFFDEQLQIDGDAASIDLRLGPRLAIAKRRRLTHIEPHGDGPGQFTGRFDEHYVPIGESFVIHPGHFVLATTLEWLRLPMTVGAYVAGKSTLARFGLSITNGAGVQPGFAGTLTLELTNLADVPVQVAVGQTVCQIFFHEVKRPELDINRAERARYVCSKRPMVNTLEVNDVDRFLGIARINGHVAK